MFAKAAIVALVGAAAVSALDARAVTSIVTRQLSEANIPSQCQGQCSSVLTIYNACLNGDATTCLSVCQADTYSNFIGCFSCILDNTPGVTQSEVDQLNGAISQLQTACSAAGQTVSAESLTAPSGAAGSDTASASGAVASFTSATGVIVGGASSAAVSASNSAATSRAVASNVSASLASVTGAAVSAASSVAASGAAGVGAHLPNFFGLAMGLVGVGAGAAFIL